VARDALLGRSNRGEAVPQLERAVKTRTDARFAVSMPQARVGIFLAIRALIRPGQKVVLSPYTIHEVVNMVICAGGIPVFCDIDRRTCNLDPAQAERAIDGDTGAVLVTHLHGLAMDVCGLAEVCRTHGAALVEDAAQAFGTRLNGRPVGTFGDAGIYSFGMYKNLNMFYGGMLVTQREDLYNRVAAEIASCPPQRLATYLAKVKDAAMTDLATFPPLFRAVTFRLFRFGYLRNIEALNKRVRVEDSPQAKQVLPDSYLCRMRPLQARIGLRALESVEEDSQRRIAFAQQYHEGLADLDDELIRPPLRSDGSHIYTYYPIQHRDRHALVRHMMNAGCDLAVQHLKNCADMECFADFRRDCPNARATAAEAILLPTYPRYSRADVARNVDAIRSFFGRSPRR
jgi:dTDP-4-amino-4,6-dideoxygalactose transaminase